MKHDNPSNYRRLLTSTQLKGLIEHLTESFYKDFGEDKVTFPKLTRPSFELYFQLEMNTENSLKTRQLMNQQGIPLSQFLDQIVSLPVFL